MNKIVYRMIIGGIVLSLFGSTTYSFYSFIHKPHSFALQFDSRFSSTICKEITAWFQQSNKTLQDVVQDLPQQFPCIKSVRYAYRQNGKYDVFIGSYSPCILWGTTHVITDQACCAPQSHFATTTLSGLPQVEQSNKTALASARVCSLFLSVSQRIFEEFIVTWNDNTSIELVHKQEPACAILAHDTSLADSTKISKAYELYFMNTKVSNKKREHQKRVYDIRFDNQILEYVMRGKWNEAKKNII